MLAKSLNIVQRLHSQQLGEKHRNLYTRIPARLQFHVESVVDNERRLLGCVLLGFTAQGHHLLSYTSTPGYRLQIWSFLWGQQAELLAEIDLFGGTSEMGSDSSDDDIFVSTDLPTSMAVSITETADQQLLIVQGCPDSTDVDDALADAMSYVTVFPHPCTHGLSLQGFHFKYASIQGQISQPLFAFIPPCTLMVHSSKGIQFLKLKQYAMPLIPNPNCSLRNIQTAQQLSQHSMALQGAAADSAAVLSQPDQQAAVAAVQPSSVQAKPAHSVWSMSASSDSLSSHQTPSCPDVSSVAKPMAGRDAPGTDADKYRRQLPDGAHVEGLSHFHTSISLRRGNDDIGFAPAVTAELMGPAFDPEKFIMGCIPHDKLNRHRLVDYTVQQVLCGDDTDRLTYGSPKCRGSSCSLSTQAGRGWSLEARACTDAAWAIVLIAAVFQPRSGAAQETVKPVALAVNICSSSGTGELLSEEWMDAAKFQQLVVNLRFFPKAYTMQQADLQRVAIVTSAECLAGKLKLKHSIPTSPHMRPVVLNNRAMLSSGRSAGLLTHPLLPICILGYGQHGNT
ncbi:hypothetical protein WJX77_008380 [Trebouxia sp. C0004]